MKLSHYPRIFIAAALATAIPYAEATAVASATPTSTPMSAAATAQAQRLTNLKAKGTVEIDRRLANLSATKTKLGEATKLSADNRSALEKQLTDQETGLTALKAKLAAETTLPAARADVTSIVTGYRVYVVMLPKVRLITAYDRFKAAEESLTNVQVKLQTKLDAAKTAGKDVTAAQASMTNLLAHLKAAQTAGDGVGAKLLALAPTDTSSRSVLVAARQSLKTAQTNMQSARDDAKAVADALK